MDKYTLAMILYVVFTTVLIVYMWRMCGIKNRLSDIESWISIREKDLKAVHDSIKQLNENQKLFLKPGEPVMFWRQEEEFHK